MERTAEQILKDLGIKDITEEMEGKTSIRFFEPPKVEPERKPKDTPKVKPAIIPTKVSDDILGNMVTTPEYEHWEHNTVEALSKIKIPERFYKGNTSNSKGDIKGDSK